MSEQKAKEYANNKWGENWTANEWNSLIEFSRLFKEKLEDEVCPFGDSWNGSNSIAVDEPCPVCGMTGEFGAEMKCIDIVR